MLLTLDIGNSRIKGAVFQDDIIVDRFFYQRTDWGEITQFIEKWDVKESIICSSGGMEEVLPLLLKNVKYIKLSHETAVPVNNTYATPETLGRDRIAAVVGANSLYPTEHNVVIDIGTCITIDLIDDTGTFLGGNIAPGLDLRLLSMHHFTANLPLVNKAWNKPIGISTETAIQNGACWGLIFEINGVISHFVKHFKPLNVILTGGDAQIVAEKVDFPVYVQPDLIFLGLKKIYDFNETY